MAVIDASGVYYKELNEKIHEMIAGGETNIKIRNVNGQRYIGDALPGNIKLLLEGTPGNDLAAYMNGATVLVQGNTQEGTANTMSGGTLVIHGRSGDATGYAMRGGSVFIRDDVGYRGGIHMKEYKEMVPAMVVGGSAGSFFGEYMAGGILMVLNLNGQKEPVGDYCGTGMHGGVMYVRGEVAEYKLGKEVRVEPLTEQDKDTINTYVKQFAAHFDCSAEDILKGEFIKLVPYNARPYGNLYTHY
ncbi:hypothetical protein MFMK1_003125 [Metallumcola ferriviriculae]|uniref:Glutamate synthase alpha subunit C-terminal domain-containing protein n=1 Tax=Metallumcola ferriviriculae TaxID=3039180 RepID=A0AAU0URR4_9FIRM|nr:hypothetical protein MFMK1_003125 [Desulfitibacteraceae bacterium MK1]